MKEKIIKYSFIKILRCIRIEKIHRKVYDDFYIQSYVITDEDRIIINKYNKLLKRIPEFRAYLKYHKNRLENKKRIINYLLKNINTDRYATSVYLTFKLTK